VFSHILDCSYNLLLTSCDVSYLVGGPIRIDGGCLAIASCLTGAVLQQLAGYVLMVWAHHVNLLLEASSLDIFADSASVRLDRSRVGDGGRSLLMD